MTAKDRGSTWRNLEPELVTACLTLPQSVQAGRSPQGWLLPLPSPIRLPHAALPLCWPLWGQALPCPLVSPGTFQPESKNRTGPFKTCDGPRKGVPPCSQFTEKKASWAQRDQAPARDQPAQPDGLLPRPLAPCPVAPFPVGSRSESAWALC